MATPVDDQKALIVRHRIEGSPPIDEDMATITEPDGTSRTVGMKDLGLRRRPSRKATRHDVFIEIKCPPQDGNKGTKYTRIIQEVVLMLSAGRVRNARHDMHRIVFILDSGAAVHVTGNHALFCAFTAEPPGRTVRAASGHIMPILGSGSIVFDGFKLTGILYVPGLTRNLVSVSKLTELDYVVEFLGSQCLVRDTRPDADGEIVGRGRRINGIYELEYLEIPLDRSPIAQSSTC